MLVCYHLVDLVCDCVAWLYFSFCRVTVTAAQTAGELEGKASECSADSSLSTRVVIESYEFVTLIQIYWNDIHSLSALGRNFRQHFKIKALCSQRAAEKLLGKHRIRNLNNIKYNAKCIKIRYYCKAWWLNFWFTFNNFCTILNMQHLTPFSVLTLLCCESK